MVGNLLLPALVPGPCPSNGSARTASERPEAHHRERDDMNETDKVVDVPATEEWRNLSDRFERIRHRHLRELFADDPDRGTRMVVSAADLTLDFSKHRIDDGVVSALI